MADTFIYMWTNSAMWNIRDLSDPCWSGWQIDENLLTADKLLRSGTGFLSTMKCWTLDKQIERRVKKFLRKDQIIFTIQFLHITTLSNNCGASAPVWIQDRFTWSVWNFWPWITDVFLRVSHEVAGASKRRLYSQATTLTVLLVN